MEEAKKLTYGDTTNYHEWIINIDTYMKKYGEIGALVTATSVPTKYTDPVPTLNATRRSCSWRIVLHR